MSRAIFTRRFWADAAERAVKTVAQTGVALLVSDTVTDIVEVDWGDVASVSLLAGLVSVLTSVASAPAPSGISPASLVPPGV